MLTRFLVVLIGAVLLISTPRADSDRFQRFAVTEPPFTALTYGIQAFLWYDEGGAWGGWAGVHLDWVRLMVFSHVKQTFAWRLIEPERGVWDWARADAIIDEIAARGLKVIARLGDTPEWAHPGTPISRAGDGESDTGVIDAPPDDAADFGRFCGAMASRYAGRIAAYQVWNEPNLAREWGGRRPDAAGYVRLLVACSEAIRAADPAAIVISAGLAPTGVDDDRATPDDRYLQAMYDADFQDDADVVGMHAPGYSAPSLSPEEAEAAGGQRSFTFRRVEDLRDVMIRNGDAARQAALLEVGWTTDTVNPDYAWFAVSEADQARYLVEAYQYAADHWTPWIGLMSAIYIAKPSWTDADEETWWSITTPGGYTRPAYLELANMAKFCGDRTIPARAPDSPEALGLVRVDPCD